jgi:TetR/AcrR family transcriptional repressor of nem operon
MAEHHNAIISAGAKLFREHGFDGVGVIEVAKEAGLTHGAFYGHFRSKADLAAESCRRAFEEQHGVWPAGMTLSKFVSMYLSGEHRDRPAEGCPVPCFAESIGRQEAIVRREYAKGFENYVRQISAQFEMAGQTKVRARKDALLLISALVGGVSAARSIVWSDREMSDRILTETKKSVMQQFGLR